MPLPSTTVTFSGSGSATIIAPQSNAQAPCTVPGAVHRTQAGTYVSYQIGPPYWEATLHFASVPSAQKAVLESFFRANWGANFTYTDENNNVFSNCRFLDTALQFVKEFRDSWTVDVHLALPSMLV